MDADRNQCMAMMLMLMGGCMKAMPSTVHGAMAMVMMTHAYILARIVAKGDGTDQPSGLRRPGDQSLRRMYCRRSSPLGATFWRISTTFLWELEWMAGTKVGLAAGRYSGKSRPDL